MPRFPRLAASKNGLVRSPGRWITRIGPTPPPWPAAPSIGTSRRWSNCSSTPPSALSAKPVFEPPERAGDVGGALTPARGQELSVWAARALVRATLEEVEGERRP